MSEPTQQTVPVPAGMTQKEFIAALKAAGIGQQQQAPAQPSPQEMQQRLQKFQMTPQLYAQLRSEDPAVAQAAYQEMIASAVREAVTASNMLVQHHVGQLSSQFQPLQQQVGTLAQERMFNQFYGKHEKLKGHDKVVRTVLASLAQGDKQPETEEELFDLLAAQSEGTIKAIDPTFSLAANQQNPGTQAPGGTTPAQGNGASFNRNPQPASFASGSGGGGPGSGGQQQSSSIFDD